MKEMHSNKLNQGVLSMKKTLFVAALAAVLVFAFAASAFAYGPVFNGGTLPPGGTFSNYNTYAPRTSQTLVWDAVQDGGAYLSWALGESWSQDTAGSPHANYATTTNKCAVCHAVHRADSAGTVLTAWNGSAAGSGDMIATGSCVFCHGPAATFTNVKIQVNGGPGAYTLSPHGRCQRCHTPSPHGAGASVYPTLAQKLFNTEADDALAADMGSNGLVLADFELAGDSAKAVTMGSGYLCTACHDNAQDPVVFAIGETEALPTIAGLGTQSPVTGHRVYAMNTNTWNEAGEYGAYYSGTTDAAGDSTVAFNNANGCKSCHDATTAWGSKAFPHGYVGTGGTGLTSGSSDAALIWMLAGADADDGKVVASTNGIGQGNGKNAALTSDGLCLKCHLSGDRTAGVGVTY